MTQVWVPISEVPNCGSRGLFPRIGVPRAPSRLAARSRLRRDIAGSQRRRHGGTTSGCGGRLNRVAVADIKRCRRGDAPYRALSRRTCFDGRPYWFQPCYPARARTACHAHAAMLEGLRCVRLCAASLCCASPTTAHNVRCRRIAHVRCGRECATCETVCGVPRRASPTAARHRRLARPKRAFAGECARALLRASG